MVKRALLIGCNYTGSKAALRGCVNDVKNFKKFLIGHGFPAENVRALTDEPTDAEKKEKEEDKKKKDKKDKKDKKGEKHDHSASMPTKKNILEGITWLVKGAAPGDILFFQFSGHGGQTKDLSGDEDDGIDEVIFPVDFQTAGHIVDDELHDKLVKAIPHGVQLFCVMDCCHSGTGLDLPFTYSSKNPKLSKVEKEDKKKKDKEKKDKKKEKDRGGKDKDKKEKEKGKDKDKKEKEKGKDKDKKDKDKKDKDKKDKSKDIEGKDKDKKDKKEKKDKKGKGRGSGDTVTANVVLVSGCLDNQTSADTSVQGSATGALTYALLQVMTQTNAKLSYEDLLYKTRDAIKAMNSKIGQIPQLSYNNPDFDVDAQVVL